MANITELTEVTAVAGTDVLYCVQGSNDRKYTPAQMLEYIRSTGFSHSPSITNGSNVDSILFDFNPTANGNITSTYTEYSGLRLDTEYSDSDNGSRLLLYGIKSNITIKNGSGDLGEAIPGRFELNQEYGSNPSVNLFGLMSYVNCYGSNSDKVTGISGAAYSFGETAETRTINEIVGCFYEAVVNNYSSNAVTNVTKCAGIEIYSGNFVSNYSGCQINTTDNYGILIHSGNYQQGSGDANITNNYGIYLDNDIWGSESNGTITNHYGLYIESFSAATNEWGIYSIGSAAKNYFNGPLTVGTTAAAAKIHSVATTEQLRLGYDENNYSSMTVNSAGTLAITTSNNKIAIGASRTPASATAAGTAGEVCWDADFLYVCVSANTWKRTALSSW